MAGPVDLQRFSGDWYLIAHIPTDRDRQAHNAVENYLLEADGSVAMTYTNRLGGFDGMPKRMTPTGYPVEGSGNALWGIRFLIPGLSLPWPFRFEYRIAYLAPDYSEMVVARSRLDFLWLFARRPQMSDADLARHAERMAAWGYDVSKLERVPQRWPSAPGGG
jgi:apolipoprotein D and lipocalin family protein